MKEQLISFKTAKLAKEKGLILHLDTKYKQQYYYLESLSNCDFDSYRGKLCQDKSDRSCCFTITQSLLQKWIRENNHIYIEVEVDFTSYPKFCYSIYKYNGDKYPYCENILYPRTYSDLYNTYEQALEEGLKEALKLI